MHGYLRPMLVVWYCPRDGSRPITVHSMLTAILRLWRRPGHRGQATAWRTRRSGAQQMLRTVFRFILHALCPWRTEASWGAMFPGARRKHRRVGCWAVFSQPPRGAFNIAATPMSSRKIYTVPVPIAPRCLSSYIGPTLRSSRVPAYLGRVSMHGARLTPAFGAESRRRLHLPFLPRQELP